MSLEQDAQNGDVARRILDDEMIVNIVKEVKKAILAELTATGAAEASRREALYFEFRGVESLMTRLKVLADNGTYARKQLTKS